MLLRVVTWLRLLREELAQGCAWVSLLPSGVAGMLLLGISVVHPWAAALGLTCAVLAWLTSFAAAAQPAERPVAVFNGLLIGLYAATHWQPGASVAVLAVLGAIASGGIALVLGRVMVVPNGLPILSLPFALVAGVLGLVSTGVEGLMTQPYVAPVTLWGGGPDAMLMVFGHLYFLDDPRAGLLVLLVILLHSRYLAVLALAGYGAAAATFTAAGVLPEALANSGWGTQAVLAALVTGGLFATPAWSTWTLAVGTAVLSAWLAMGMGQWSGAGLQPLSVPFVLTAWLALLLALRHPQLSTLMHLQQPDLPERAHERARIARARLGASSSVPLAAPFAGAWTVSQGQNGEHTHRDHLRFALDFIMLVGDRSFTGQGRHLEDFHCYNQPVHAPATGQVWHVVNDVPDNLPGTINARENWGNCVVIRMANGLYAVVAHLRPGSTVVQPGAWVQAGDLLGHCGNSGRSPQPHIHLHVQSAPALGSPTVPFHLAGVMVAAPTQAPRFHLANVPVLGSLVAPTTPGDVRPLHVMAGRGIRYRVQQEGETSTAWSVHCELDAMGRWVLVSSRGARCVVESTWAVFSCFERDSTPDPLLDFWILGCGYMPVSADALGWQDHGISRQLLPSLRARVASALTWPVSHHAVATYSRSWDAGHSAWLQTGQVQIPFETSPLQMQARLVPQGGCTALSIHWRGQRTVLHAEATFQLPDYGIPAWEMPHPTRQEHYATL